MKKTEINMWKLVFKTKNWKKIELKKIIFKFFKRTINATKSHKYFIQCLEWNFRKKYFISHQTNVCKKSGIWKRTFNEIGLSRHELRQELNLNKIPHIKKLSW